MECMESTGYNCQKNIFTSDLMTFYIVYYGVFYLITLVSLVGNSLVLLSWFRHKKLLRSPVNYAIFYLAISDIVLAIIYTIYVTSHMESDGISIFFGHWEACMGVMFLLTGSQFSSSWHLVLLTFIRYRAVVHPYETLGVFSGQRSLFMSGGIWLVSLTLGLLISVDWAGSHFTGVCRYETFITLQRLLVDLLLNFFLPISIMVGLYARLAYLTHKQVSRISDESSLQGVEYDLIRTRMLRKNRKLAKMAAILLGYFIFAWLPLSIFLIVSTLCSNCERNIPSSIRAGFRLILHSNTAANVFIYAVRHPDFRKVFVHDFVNFCCYTVHYKQKVSQRMYNSDANLQTGNISTITDYNRTGEAR